MAKQEQQPDASPRRAGPWPWAVCLIIVALSAIEPLTHAWIQNYPPEGAVPTGIHTGDSAHHLLCMRSFGNGFFSPFATCQAPKGAHHYSYFAVPIFHLYGIVGEVAKLLHINAFLFLGIANGLGGALLLVTVYRFLRRAFPALANRAFYLYALGGGLGGVAFLVAGLFDMHDRPDFELLFQRFAWYELIEGQHLSPALLLPRLYYTVPLALGFSGLTAYGSADRNDSRKHLLFAAFLLFLATAMNLRVGPMFFGVIVLYALCGAHQPITQRITALVAAFAAVAAGGGVFWSVLRLHPSYAGNVSQVTDTAMRLLPYLSATVLLWLAALGGMRRALARLPRPLYCIACAILGYLAAYTLGAAGYHIYYGNWLYGGDATVPLAVSDWALLGIMPGFATAWFRPKADAPETAAPEAGALGPGAVGWAALWLLGYLALSISAFGGGWFLRLSPERLMVMIGLPLAVIAAYGLQGMPVVRRRILYTALLGCGIVSIGVGALWFQGPWGRTPGQGPFAYLHYAHMTERDAGLLERLPEGTAIAPPWSPIAFGEVIALREGMRVVGGPGAMNLGEQPFGPLQTSVNTFFSAATTDADRRGIARAWCVEYVYCPDTCPIDRDLLDAFQDAPWLKQLARSGQGRIFMVVLE